MTTSPSQAGETSTPWSRTIILITVSLCTMLYALTLTIVNVALPQLQGALSATPDQISWVVTLNVVATAVVTPATGWIVANWGQRSVLIWSIVGFSICSLACATAESLAPLLVYRIGQGIFGAPLVPLAQAIIVATYPPEERASAQGWFGMSVVIGPAIAPALGGYLAEAYNWRWIFLLILPLCAVSLIGVILFIRDTAERAAHRLDWTGFIALSIAVTCLQLVMDRGERLDWFESPEILLLSAALIGSFYIFLAHTFTYDKPFINPELFKDQNFVVGLFLVFIYGMLNVTPTVLFPTMLQTLKGYPDSLIGMMLGARGVGMVAGFFLAARMGRLDPRFGLVLGLVMVGCSGWLTATWDFNVSPTSVALTGVLQGLGCGVMWVPLSVVTFASLQARLLPDASSIFHLLRNFGSSLFISICVMIVARTSKINYAEISEGISPYSERLAFPSVVGSWNTESVRGLWVLSNEIGRQSQMIGYTNAFWLYTAAAFGTVPLLFLVRIKQR